MYILVLPVSGGGFVSQLAILQHLCESKFVPNLTLASSGGNVAAYVAAAADWKWSSIERISRELSQSLFSSPWNSLSPLSLIIGYFKGDVYNKGTGVSKFLTNYFDSDTIKKYEIWTGTYNKTRHRARLFCNTNRDSSILDTSSIDPSLTQSMEPIFSNGDLDLIGQSVVASASIPAIVPCQTIMGEDYIDGGIACASPLTVMHDPILKYIRDHNDSLHLFYVNSVDLSHPVVNPIHNVLDNWRQATHDLIRSQTVSDRLSGYKLLCCNSGTMHKEEFICNYQNLQHVKDIQSKVKFSMLEIYPINIYDIDISNFNGNDVINGIHNAYPNCRCRLWWLSSDSSDDIYSIIDQCKNC